MSKPEVIDYAGDYQAKIFSEGDLDRRSVPRPVVELPTSTKPPLVAVLLCTRNGDRFLAEQLDSINAQDHRNLTVWASDDGSEDNTNHILEEYQALDERDRFAIQFGPKQGFAANFLSLICRPDIEADYYAYADQDDIWQPDKLSRAITKMKSIPSSVPTLYCSRTCLIDENGDYVGLSPLFGKPPSFSNALVQNIGGGNTMVMNKAARDLLCAAGDRTVVSHDWWAYMLVTGAGGKVIYDSYSSVRYRQHDNNMVGSNNGWQARLLRLRLLLQGRFRNWNTTNALALQQVRHLLTPENRSILDKFCTARNRWLIPRIRGIMRSGIYRQTLIGNIGLMAAIVLNKF